MRWYDVRYSIRKFFLLYSLSDFEYLLIYFIELILNEQLFCLATSIIFDT